MGSKDLRRTYHRAPPLNLPTLYFSADMSAYQASVKLACSQMHLTTDEVEERLAGEGRKRREILDKLEALNMTFSFGAISWPGVDAELEADMKPFRAVEETGSGGLYDVSAYARVRVHLVGGPAVLLVLKELA